jgi:hypothetical protein
LAKKSEPPARFLGQTAVPIGRFEVSENIVDSPKPFKSLEIRFESSTMALTNLTTLRVADEATVLAVEVEVEDRY